MKTMVLAVCVWFNEASGHYVMVSRSQWKPFWLATHLYPQNDWTGWQFPVCYDVIRTGSFDEVECVLFKSVV